MSRSQVLALGLCAEFNRGCTDHQHCMPVVGAGGGCGKAIGKFEVCRLKMLCRSKNCRSLIGPKDGRDGWTSEQRYAEHTGMQLANVSAVELA